MHQYVAAASFEEWNELISSSFVPLISEPIGSRPLKGHLVRKQFGNVAWNQIHARPHVVARNKELIQKNEQAYYKFSFQQSGHALLIQDGREAIISPGQFAIYDTSRPYTLAFEDHFSTSVVMIPQERLPLGSQEISQLTATSLGEKGHLSYALTQLVNSSTNTLLHTEDPIGRQFTNNVVDLLCTIITQELYSGGFGHHTDDDAHSATLNSILSYIDEHLADPQLTPQRLAVAHCMSVRSLHQLFEGSGHTVAATIRAKRLKRCSEDLRNPLRARLPVAAIGAHWGFHDPAYFSRIFRKEFGVPPAEFRKQSQNSAP